MLSYLFEVQEAEPPAGSMRAEPSSLSVSHTVLPSPIAPLHLLPEQVVKGTLGCSPIAVERHTHLTACADPPPVPDEGGAAEKIFLQGEAIEAPAIGGGIDAREIGLFGKETELGEGA